MQAARVGYRIGRSRWGWYYVDRAVTLTDGTVVRGVVSRHLYWVNAYERCVTLNYVEIAHWARKLGLPCAR